MSDGGRRRAPQNDGRPKLTERRRGRVDRRARRGGTNDRAEKVNFIIDISKRRSSRSGRAFEDMRLTPARSPAVATGVPHRALKLLIACCRTAYIGYSYARLISDCACIVFTLSFTIFIYIHSFISPSYMAAQNK